MFYTDNLYIINIYFISLNYINSAYTSLDIQHNGNFHFGIPSNGEINWSRTAGLSITQVTNNGNVIEAFATNGTTKIFNLLENGNLALGDNVTPSAKLHVKGTGATSGTTALLVQNATPAELFKITDDGSLYTVGFQGFTGTGAYTNFTIKNGIITAAS